MPGDSCIALKGDLHMLSSAVPNQNSRVMRMVLRRAGLTYANYRCAPMRELNMLSIAAPCTGFAHATCPPGTEAVGYAKYFGCPVRDLYSTDKE